MKPQKFRESQLDMCLHQFLTNFLTSGGSKSFSNPNSTGLFSFRKTIRARYSFLPMWYTLFYEGERFGVPPMRPLWYEFPEDEGTFDREGIHMIGNALLVAPVMKSGETKVNIRKEFSK